ncbi:MAG: ATP-binding protein [Phycisphaeraceae bacterium]|nr:ATP-binding protein [Phycisphaeraceae bacterium]
MNIGQSQIREPLVIPSILTEGVKVVEIVIEAIQPLGYSDTALFAIRLALDEALANAIRHGNQSDESKTVEIDYSIDDQQVKISITDQGPGFHPSEIPDPTLDENLERPCGRGVMLMRAYMTEVFFNESGNCVTMIKRKDCKLPHVPQD